MKEIDNRRYMQIINDIEVISVSENEVVFEDTHTGLIWEIIADEELPGQGKYLTSILALLVGRSDLIRGKSFWRLSKATERVFEVASYRKSRGKRFLKLEYVTDRYAPQ